MEHPLDIAVRESGLKTIAALARELGVTRAAADQWREDGRVVPAEHCPKIERLSNGKVRCEQLNHKVDWEYVRSAGQAEALSSLPEQVQP